MDLKRAVVTGMGALTPIGLTVRDFWSAAVHGTSGAAPITHFDASAFKTRFACELKGLEIGDFIHRKEQRRLDLFSQYALICADQAVQDSGVAADDSIDKDRVGVIWSSGIGGLNVFEEEITAYATGDGTPRFNPFFIPKMIVDIAPGHISMRYGFRGINFAPVAACASSTIALIDALNYIRLGKADVIVTGGSEAPITPGGVGGFGAMRALSTRNDECETASRPFDATRDGFVIGEGAGALVIEELEHAKRRGATILAELSGGGMSADAHHLTAPHPEGLGAKNVMTLALDDAGLNADDLDHINVHGTSTPLGDVAELIAVRDVFGHHAFELSISSTKSMTGHLLGAAGAIEAVASVQAVREGVVPPTINHTTSDDRIDPRFDLTLNQAKERPVRAALSNTFGFGGHNASVVFRRFEG